MPNSVMELAEQEGYFDRAGVEVEFVRVQQTPLAMAALRAGEGEMANVALEALLQATAAGRRRPARRDVAEQVAALPDRRARRHRRARRPRRQALRHRPDRQRRPPPVDEGARGRRRRRLDARARRPRPAAVAGAGAARRADRRDDDGHRQLHRDRRRPERSSVLVGVDAYYRAAPILSKLNVVRTDTLAERRRRGRGGDRGDHPRLARLRRAPRRAGSRRCARPAPTCPRPTSSCSPRPSPAPGASTAASPAPELEEAQAWLHAGEDFAGIEPAPLEAWADLAPLEAVLAKIGPVEESDVPTR